jgi:formamidopyrimidine-DNA glycosylase
MPELPEVENVRRSLQRRLADRIVVEVHVLRPDIIRGDPRPEALLLHQRLIPPLRHGKQLALASTSGGAGGAIVIHLGMTGSLRIHEPAPSPTLTPALAPHTHTLWGLDDGNTLAFSDPRRFGGIWTFPSLEALQRERWSALGPDALSLTPDQLAPRFAGTSRGIKAALLDQSLVAGLGNIYTDELLFRCGLHPATPARRLTPQQQRNLIHCMSELLNQAIHAGGSTLRDYVDSDGAAGAYQNQHLVYAKAGSPCPRCAGKLRGGAFAGRSTTWCPRCQPKPRATPR